MSSAPNNSITHQELTDEQLELVAGGRLSMETVRDVVLYVAPKIVNRFVRPAPKKPGKDVYVSTLQGGIYAGRRVYRRPDGRFVLK